MKLADQTLFKYFREPVMALCVLMMGAAPAFAEVYGTMCYCGVHLSGSVSNADCVNACGDDDVYTGGNGGWSPPIQTGPTQEELHQQRQDDITRWGEDRFIPLYQQWQQNNAMDAAAKRARESTHRLRQERAQASAAHRVAMANNWNDEGVRAYKKGNRTAALRYFRAARTYMPEDDGIAKNLGKAESKVREQAKSYLASVATVLTIKSLSPKVLLFHPDPNVRMNAQKALAEESLKKIVEATSVFIYNEHLNRGQMEPFRWESAEERARRKRFAKQHAVLVNELMFEAFAENRVRVEQAYMQGDIIEIDTGPAMRQLLELTHHGFD